VTRWGEHNFERCGKHAAGFVAVWQVPVIKKKLMLKTQLFFLSLYVLACVVGLQLCRAQVSAE
jgi:hypothetical protein